MGDPLSGTAAVAIHPHACAVAQSVLGKPTFLEGDPNHSGDTGCKVGRKAGT